MGKLERVETGIYRMPSGRYLVKVHSHTVKSNAQSAYDSAASLAEARTKRRELQDEVGKGFHQDASNPRFIEFAEAWVLRRRPSVAPNTLGIYESVVSRLRDSELAYKRLRKITPDEIEIFLNERRRDTTRRRGPTGQMNDVRISSKTVRTTYDVVKVMLDNAVAMKLIAYNPAAALPPPTHETPDKEAPEPEELATVLDIVQQDVPFFTYLWLSKELGFRRNETLALQWSDVDLKALRVQCVRSVTNAKVAHIQDRTDLQPLEPVLASYDPDRKIVCLKVTKKSKRSAAHFGEQTTEILNSLWTWNVNAAKLAGTDPPSKSSWLFPKPTDPRLPASSESMTRRTKDVLREAGLPEYSLHDLRHFMATEWVYETGSFAIAAGRTGQEISTVASRYAHKRDGADRQFAIDRERRLNPDLDISSAWESAAELDALIGEAETTSKSGRGATRQRRRKWVNGAPMISREEFLEACSQARSSTEILRRLNLGAGGREYRALEKLAELHEVELPSSDLPKEDLVRAVQGSKSRRHILRRLGWKISGKSYTRLEREAERLEVDLPDTKQQATPKADLDDPVKVRAAVEGATSKAEIMRRLGLSKGGKSYKILDETLHKHGLSDQF